MGVGELLRWQWEGYARFHRSRTNLLIHIVAVPVFLLGDVAVLAALVERSLPLGVGGLAAMAISLIFQGRGHRTEEVPTVPFTGPANAFARIFLEQWVTFPRFVLSGGWARALRGG